MARGYMGKILNVDLSSGQISEESLDENLCRQFIGGYGLGAKLLYDRMPAGVDALGPDNILGFLTGPLTGSPSIEGNRFVVVCKSPLTDTWGDANCGGTFGPHLKFAGVDGILFSGASDTPVYLCIQDGVAELRDASDLWGKDSNETEDALKGSLGDDFEVACIGPAGEKLSLISAVMNDKGRAAGRSGVGAVMGSKKLKAIAVSGSAEVPLADADKAKSLRREFMKRSGGFHDFLAQYGTTGISGDSAISGDSPVKNWGGVGRVDFPTGGQNFSADAVYAYQDKAYGCWRCTMACGGHDSVKEEGPYKGVAHHKPEYETVAAWGTMTLMDKFPALIKINELCNRYGFDTIAAGCTAAFAVECYENGILTKEDTGGIELNWGNDVGLISLLEKMAAREGIGDVLADGVRKASQKIGKGSEEYAIHVQGAEIPMHDPKFQPGLATTYKLDATPGRHTQGHEDMPPLIEGWPEHDKYEYSGKGDAHRKCMAQIHMVNSAGVCMFAYLSYDWDFIPEFLTAVTGWVFVTEECYRVGERIADIRHAFNLREGLNPIEFAVPKRLLGDPPQTEGNVRNITVDIDTQVRDYCAVMDWDPETAVPSKERLVSLGLDEVARDLHG